MTATKTYRKRIKEYSISKTTSSFPIAKIQSSADSEAFIRQFYGDDIGIYESFFILLLDRANNTIGFAKISQGGVYSTVVDLKIIMKYAIDDLACGVILAHNHPSGQLKPSSQDLDVTAKVKSALALIDTTLLDHIILTETDAYSMADAGLI